MKIRILVAGIFLGIAFMIPSGMCQPGAMDPDFGMNGVVRTSFGKWYNHSTGMALQADNKIILAGFVNRLDSANIALARYTPSGEFDNNFSVDGIVITDFGPYADDAYSIAIAPDGKIVLAGCGYTGADTGHDFYVVRYNTDGTLDQAFSEDGKVASDFSASSDFAYSVLVQQDGKIIATGYVYDLMDFALIRYNSDGSPDNTFGENGRVTTHFDEAISIAYCSLIQTDGKIVVAGSSQFTGVDMNIALARYNPDGTLDNTFSVDGKVVTSLSPYTELAKAIALQPDGKIMVAGTTDDGIDSDIALVRYNPDGTLDLSFSEDGKVITDVPCMSVAGTALLLQPDHKIVVAGTADNGSDYDILLIRYNPDGSVDLTFGMDGMVITDINEFNNEAVAVALSDDGDIIVTGNSYASGAGNSELFIASYLSELNLGILDFSCPDNVLRIYPNPVRGQTAFEYELHVEENISLDLINNNGRVIQSFLFGETRAPGKHLEMLTIDPDIPPGIYTLIISCKYGAAGIQIVKAD